MKGAQEERSPRARGPSQLHDAGRLEIRIVDCFRQRAEFAHRCEQNPREGLLAHRRAHGGGRTAPTPVAPAEMTLIVPMRSSRRLHRHHFHRDELRRRPLLQPARNCGAVDQGGERGHPLDPALLSPVPGQRGSACCSGSSPTPVQDRRPFHSARRILRPASGREPLDIDTLSANPRMHYVTRMASGGRRHWLHIGNRGLVVEPDVRDLIVNVLTEGGYDVKTPRTAPRNVTTISS
jgi:hypothetical protein